MPFSAFSQSEGDVGNQTILTVKSYKPILAESSKISDEPEADTTSSVAPVFNYNLEPARMETNYESAVIQAKKIKDETISKLYRSYIKLGGGNYEKAYAELWVNSLRSKNSLLGLHAKHFSASPNLNDVAFGGYSNNTFDLNGKFMLSQLDINSALSFNRDVFHYYGFSPSDTIIDKDNYKQRFALIGFDAGVQSRYTDKDHLQFGAGIQYKTLSDLYDVNEGDFDFAGNVSKKLGEAIGKIAVDFNYFKKTDANFQLLSSNSNLSRNIVRIRPEAKWKMDKMLLTLGVGLEFQKNLETSTHFFPDVHIMLPIAEQVLSFYGDVEGKIIKNTFNTMRIENPFITSSIIPLNTVEKYKLSTGLRGNISSALSFHAGISYASYTDMNFFITDTLAAFPVRFNTFYADAKRFGLHAEAGYSKSEKFSIKLGLNQYAWSVETIDQPFHRPSTEVTLKTAYNLRDKVIASLTVFGRGYTYARVDDGTNITSEKIKGFADVNLGIEYRYSKIVSFYIQLNNVGFTKYQYWYGYPNERLNVLGGITFAFWPYKNSKTN